MRRDELRDGMKSLKEHTTDIGTSLKMASRPSLVWFWAPEKKKQFKK